MCATNAILIQFVLSTFYMRYIVYLTFVSTIFKSKVHCFTLSLIFQFGAVFALASLFCFVCCAALLARRNFSGTQVERNKVFGDILRCNVIEVIQRACACACRIESNVTQGFY